MLEIHFPLLFQNRPKSVSNLTMENVVVKYIDYLTHLENFVKSDESVDKIK